MTVKKSTLFFLFFHIPDLVRRQLLASARTRNSLSTASYQLQPPSQFMTSSEIICPVAPILVMRGCISTFFFGSVKTIFETCVQCRMDEFLPTLCCHSWRLCSPFDDLQRTFEMICQDFINVCDFFVFSKVLQLNVSESVVVLSRR